MKIGLKKQIRTYAAPPGRFEVVTVPPMQFLMIDGHGDPTTSAVHRDALATIYPVAYQLKLLSKNELERDYVVMPPEALWWSDDMESFTAARDESRWQWTVMTVVPDWNGHDHVQVVRQAIERNGGASARTALRCETLDEGPAVQTLHVGSYDDEGPVLEAVHREFIPSHALRMTGRHHEVYPSDARRTAPRKRRTILRQPVTGLNR